MNTTESITAPETDEVESAAQAANEQSIELMARAEAFTIATAAEYQTSGDLLRDIKARQKAVTDTRTGITKPMDAAKKRVMDIFKPVSDRLIAAEQTIKAAMLTFAQVEERRQRAEQAERERIAEVERKRLESRAAAARESGNEEKADVLEETATQVAPPPPEAPTKAAGVHTVTTWRAEVTDKMALIKAAAADANLAPYLTVEMPKLNALARSLKGEMNIPGVRAVAETGVAARAR